LLPERDQKEVEEYWNSEDEEKEGLSDSECASSKMGDETPVPLEPEKKKRPPRKKKKKNKVAEISLTMSQAPSADLMRGVSPVRSGDGDTPVKGIAKEAETPPTQPSPPAAAAAAWKPGSARPGQPAVARGAPVPTKPLQTARAPTAQQSINGGAKQQQPLRQPPQAEPYSLDRSRNQKYTPPQRPGAPGATSQMPSNNGWQQQQQPHQTPGDWAGPQQQHYQLNAPKQKAGWTVAHQHQPAQGPRGWSTQPAVTHGAQRGPPQPQPQPTPVTPKGPAAGSWAAKISTKKPTAAAPQARKQAQPQARAQPPPQRQLQLQPPPPPSPMHNKQMVSVVPPSPSSDWRHHTLAPSPRTGGKVMESWPGLGDFPAPPSMGTTTPKAGKPMGSWPAPPSMGKTKIAPKAGKPTGAWGKR
jgi:hypothetical protein